MSNEQIGAWVVGFLGGGGGIAICGWGLKLLWESVKRLDKLDLTSQDAAARLVSVESSIKSVTGLGGSLVNLSKDVSDLTASCKACRDKMNDRLDAGTGEFHKTHLDILAQAKSAADLNAELRLEMQRNFVSEATFKDRVVATMIASCPVCRRGDGK